MKVTYNWLKDFVEISLSPEDLADRLTMAGLEVTGIEKKTDDYVFDIEITSNRPDWLSVLGVAREVAVVTGKRLKNLRLPVASKKDLGKKILAIKIEDKKDCPWYTARIFKEIKVGPSPSWLRSRLELVGCRSVNNIVDITNYCLFEFGEPLHAFDWDTLGGGYIWVRRARPEEKITLIDGTQRQLNNEILVIADKTKPVAIAGIMGGKDTEVSSQTKTILLEAAIFNPVVTRKARRYLGISTESSYRFERGIDPNAVGLATSRATQLLQELAGARLTYIGSTTKPKTKKVIINLGLDFVTRISGVKVDRATVKGVLKGLGFIVKEKQDKKECLVVERPSYRQDVTSAVDLVEEVTRIYGFEKIPTTLPAVKPQQVTKNKLVFISELKNLLVGLGLQEVITYSLISPDILNGIFDSKEGLASINNFLNKEQKVLRPTLLPSLLDCVSHNIKQKNECIAIFEVAKTFQQKLDVLKEKWCLGIALCGTDARLTTQGLLKEEFGWLHLKGILEAIFERIGLLNVNWEMNPVGNGFQIKVKEEVIANILKPAVETLNNFDIKNKEAFLAEVDLDKVFSLPKKEKRFVPLPKYPAIVRDISFVVNEGILIKDIIDRLRQEAGGLLEDIKVLDFYRGRQIPEGFISITLSFIFRSSERTLNEEEINPLQARVCQVLEQSFQARLR